VSERIEERADEPEDAAVRALRELVAQLDRTTVELEAAAERAGQLIAARAAGRSWHEIVAAEQRPLIVETITRALEVLGDVGSRFRREEALALRRERLSITRISELFGVSRQRVSALVQERPRG
jgi:hypothetical protein